MKLMKGWKTLTFNILAIAVMQWDDVRQGILALFGGWEYAVCISCFEHSASCHYRGPCSNDVD
jgi:hypothetical protein